MNPFTAEFDSLGEAATPAGAGQASLNQVTARDDARLEFTLRWRSMEASHTDIHHAQSLNLWRDFMPPELESALVGRPVGDTVDVEFPPGALVPPHAERDCRELNLDRFERRIQNGRAIEPHAGRFYPKGRLSRLGLFNAEDITPFRIGALTGNTFIADLNHPLAAYPLKVETRILAAWQAGPQRGGASQDVAERITGHGPGMQARWRAQPTDFFGGDAFARERDDDDADFYRAPRLVDHLDRIASQRLQALYARLLPENARVLDLMASWKSHLDATQPAQVAGLGMNAEELAANPVLAERIVQDLNREPRLPFADARFDAIVCSLSVEYLIRPFEVFAEARRVLRPGGLFVLSFSNRYFPPKAIRVWTELHPFERMGLVLEYFLRDGGFTDLNTYSLAGLPRPEDDKYAAHTPWSDPLYAVWGRRAA